MAGSVKGDYYGTQGWLLSVTHTWVGDSGSDFKTWKPTGTHCVHTGTHLDFLTLPLGTHSSGQYCMYVQ
jgi:hypothetical protein